MTDRRLRDLERDAAHGDLQAQVRLLLERVRIGDLTEERLQLAAYLGDEGARLAAGKTVPIPEGRPWEGLTQRWLAGLGYFAIEALARGVVVAATVIEARTTPATAEVHACPADGGRCPPYGCHYCELGPRYAAATAAEWLRRPSDALDQPLGVMLWFPEFEGEAVRAEVRLQLLPWALAPHRSSP